jgi:murein DD-endopeptidase MepM/ murein hydrolase activator NlpD
MAKQKKNLLDRLTSRFQLVIRNEDNLEERTLGGLSNGRVLVILTVIFTSLFFLCLFLAQTLLAIWYDPRHAQREANQQLMELAIRMDSLAIEVERKDQFINSIQKILRGDTTGIADPSELMKGQNKTVAQPGDLSLGETTGEFRKDFEQTDLSLSALTGNNYSELQETFFFSPITGFITDKYDARRGHFGVDIGTKANEPIKCIADGTVILSSWTQDSGYVIMVQHQGNLTSVYKHNAELLKKVGAFVNAGEILSIVGNSGEMTSGPHLHFELWYNGNAINPEEFVTF